MISYFQAIIIGGMQGIAELFPISSLGHSVILPKLLGWNIDQGANSFLIFLVATHLATALVLLGFFFKDWVLIVKGMLRSLKMRRIDPADAYTRLGWLIVVSSIPAGILGLLFEEKLKQLFASPMIAALFLTINGLLLFDAEILRKNATKNETVASASMSAKIETDSRSDETIAKITWEQAMKVGLAQCLALIPGLSRTGSTIAGGLLIGLSHKNAARFSFLLATPIILAASVLKLPELLTASAANPIDQIIAGSIAAAITAYFSIRFLVRYFETEKLTPFAIYCALAGIVSMSILSFR